MNINFPHVNWKKIHLNNCTICIAKEKTSHAYIAEIKYKLYKNKIHR